MNHAERLTSGALRRCLMAIVLGLAGASPAAAGDGCGMPGLTGLESIHGGAGPPIPEGREVVVEARVSARFPGDDGLNGFYITTDASSAGLFVYAPAVSREAMPGQHERWRIRAHTGRYRGEVQLERIVSMARCGHDRVEPVRLDPAHTASFERLRDRLVRIDDRLSVAEVYDLGRYGTLRLARGGRPFHPNNGVAGGERLDLLLDDGSYQRSPRPVPHTRHGVRRAGDQVEGITGILTRAFGRWRIHPTQPPRFHASNPRPQAPPDATGIRAVALNLHNYFTDRAGRGARTAAAFERQRMRLRRLVRRLDPDLLALHEIENQPETVNDLLALLNDGAPPSRRYRATLRPRSDAVIRSVLLYRPARLAMTRPGRQVHAVHPRDPVAARFQMADGVTFEVATAHFKSRGGCPDQGDIDRGAGCWAARRNAQSRAMIDWLAKRMTPPSPDRAEAAAVLVLADFNAYAEETAIQRWRAAGYTDLLAAHLPAAARYTYNYHGRAGYLDHALASDTLLEHIADVRVWSINADESAHLARSGTGVWRLSDHDPIIIDLAARRPVAQ